ncbi:MAG: HEAT repeat domain-containing protein [Candidatus Omnitrophica bacterium]|nr:HEAT repeat domain-containing protein [Candidatus Omnitrophota bacterium]
MEVKLSDLKAQSNKSKFLLGKLIYNLNKAEQVRFFYSPDTVGEQNTIKKIFSLLNGLEASYVNLKKNKEAIVPFSPKKLDVPKELIGEKHPEIAKKSDVKSKEAKSPSDKNALAQVDSLEQKQISEIAELLSDSEAKEDDNRPVADEEKFIEGLKDIASTVRTASIKGLSNLLKEKCFDHVAPLLDDPDPYVRGMAATCLGIHCAEEGVKAVSRLKNDTDSHVQKCLEELFTLIPQGSSTEENIKSDSRDEEKKTSNPPANKKQIKSNRSKNNDSK